MAKPERPMQCPLPPDLKDQLENVLENSGLLEKQLRSGRDLGSCDHVLATAGDFLPTLEQCAHVVSDASTKLALLFSKPPLPSSQECGVVCNKMENAMIMLTSTCSQFPEHQGHTLTKEVRASVLGVLNGVSTLMVALMESGCAGTAHLRGAGTVWEACDSIPKISKVMWVSMATTADNRLAVLRVFISQLHLLRDVCSQVEDLMSNNGVSDDPLDITDPPHEGTEGEETEEEEEKEEEEEEGWTQSDRKIVDPCIKLIKTASEVTEGVSRLIVTCGRVEEQGCIKELDKAAQEVEKLSPLCDDLAEEMEAPVDHKQCTETGMKLAKAVGVLLSVLDHFCVNPVASPSSSSSAWEGEKFCQVIRDVMAAIENAGRTA